MRAHRSHRLVALDDCLIAADGARPVRAPMSRRSTGPSTGHVDHEVTPPAQTHSFAVAADGFWQVHPEAPRVLVETVLDLLDPQEGERALDLYAGVGLFARFVGEATGARVVAVEADRTACQHARGNLSALKAAVVECGPTDRVLRRASTSRSTSSCSTRPARAPSGPSSSRSSTAAPAPWRTSPATPPRSAATSRSSPSTATRSPRSAPSTSSR